MATATKDKLTGPGAFQKLPDGSTLLFNFDIDSSVLKPEHRAFLERNIVSAANANPAGLRVVIGGSADRLGDAGHNIALSNRRIRAVSTFLEQRKPGYLWTFEGFGQGVGEATAERAGDKDNTRDDLFRSVIIEVLKPGQPIPRKPDIPEIDPQNTKATEQRLVAKKTFEEAFIDRPPVDLDPESGVPGFAIGTAIVSGVKDFLRMQKNPIEGSDFDNGVVQSRQNLEIPLAHVMKTVNIDKEVRELPRFVTFGASELRFNITRTYRYSYGVGLPTELVRVSTTSTVIPRLSSRFVVQDTRTVPQPLSLLDPR